jgi:hypothetical protein
MLWGLKLSGVISVMIIIVMVLRRNQLTTIAISKKTHFELSERCKKGQSFESILTEILKKSKESKESKENSVGQSKSGVDRPDTSTAGLTRVQTTTKESDLNP